MFDRETDEAESWYGSLGRMAARSAQAALPGVIQGVKTGAAAGPWGAVTGGLAGGISRLVRPQTSAVPAAPPPAPAPAVPRSASAMPSVPTPAAHAPAVAADPGAANPAAGELVRLIQDPRVLQALAAGAQGQREVPVAGTSAPPAAFMNLLAWLAQEAAQQIPTAGQPAVDGYLRGPDGAYVTDVVSPSARARVLLERLQAERGEAARPAATASPEQWLVECGLAEMVEP